MRQVSLAFVPTAILSRQVAVIRGSLIINLPGQPKGVAETLEGLKDADGSQRCLASSRRCRIASISSAGRTSRPDAVVKCLPAQVGDPPEGLTALQPARYRTRRGRGCAGAAAASRRRCAVEQHRHRGRIPCASCGATPAGRPPRPASRRPARTGGGVFRCAPGVRERRALVHPVEQEGQHAGAGVETQQRAGREALERCADQHDAEHGRHERCGGAVAPWGAALPACRRGRSRRPEAGLPSTPSS